MIIFIGGPPRVGKSTIAKLLSKKLKFSYCSTDNLRESVIYGKLVDTKHPINSVKNAGEWDNIKQFYSKYSVDEIINIQNRESKEVSNLIVGFTKSLNEDSERNFIIEGVALLPDYYNNKFLQNQGVFFLCVGNTNYKTFVDYSWEHRSRGDWLKDVDKKTFNKAIKYCSEFSKIFKQQSKKAGLSFYEIKSQSFKKDVNNLVEKIESKIGNYG